ncbi:MAG: trypsin-like peptidase domain-containing protein, partial [Myxococcales bacterium]|nr:trypsin-like peptidase domain-containing protein [Myxococcales bacterium]
KDPYALVREPKRVERISSGSGTKPEQVTELVQRFVLMRQMTGSLGQNTGMMGKILVMFADPAIDIRLSRGGREVKRARQQLIADDLASGVYVATVELAQRTLREDILLLPGESVERRLTVPKEQHERADLAFLVPFGVSSRDGFVYIDGVPWPLASPPLTEVLALLLSARMSAQAEWSGISESPPGRTRVLVVVAAPDEADSLSSVGAAVDQVGGARRDVLPGRVGLGSHAVIIHGDIAPGPIEVRLELPGIVQTNIAAIAYQGDTLAVLVSLRKSGSSASAVVHLAQLAPTVPLEVVRDFERAQQVLSRAPALDPAVVQRAADAAASAPLFAILAGAGANVDAAITTRGARELQRAVGREQLPGAIWSTWVRERPTLHVRRGASRSTFASAPASWLVLEAHRAAIEQALPAVGTALLGGQGVGTAFLIAPDVAVTASFIANEGQLSFRFGDVTLKPKEVLQSDPRSFLAFIRLERAVGVDPLPVAKSVPSLAEPRAAYLLTWFVDGGPQAFSVSPGLISAIRPAREVPIAGAPDAGLPTHDVLIHDCDSRPGTAGAPLLDLTTGEVVGLHHSGEDGLSQTGIATVLVQSMMPPQH